MPKTLPSLKTPVQAKPSKDEQRVINNAEGSAAAPRKSNLYAIAVYVPHEWVPLIDDVAKGDDVSVNRGRWMRSLVKAALKSAGKL